VVQSTIVQLAQLSPGSRIAAVCQTPRFHEIISRMLKSISPNLTCENHILERAQYPYLDGIPEDVNVLVLYTHSALLSDERCKGMLEDFRARGGVVVEFFYEMDDGSRMFIQTVVADLYREKGLSDEPGTTGSPEHSVIFSHEIAGGQPASVR
jgi:hypothetical protein